MAILYARRKPGAGTGTGEGGSQTFRTEYTVKSSTPNETRTAVLLCGLVPTYGAPHPENPFSVCVRVDATQNRDDPYLWDVVAEWNAITRGKRAPLEEQKAPPDRRPQWRGRFIEVPQYWFFDLDNVPFFDKAGSPFSPPPSIPIFVDEITIVRYESELNRATHRNFLNATNTDTWNEAEPNTAWVKDISFEEMFEFGQYYFLMTYVIFVSPRIAASTAVRSTNDASPTVYQGGFNPIYILNAGPKSLVEHAGKKVPTPHTDMGISDGQPQLLDKDGVLIPRNETTGIPTPPYYYIPFRTVKTTAFGPLNLVPPW